jgi:mRNA-degrading endonuclease RelE of RelBE toxin-antitoxin system
MHRTYQLEISPATKRDLKKIPSQVKNKIVFEHLPKIQDEPYSNSVPLIGALKGERSYHFGRKPEYRIIYYKIENIEVA